MTIETGKYFKSFCVIDASQVDMDAVREEAAAISEQCRLMDEGARLRSFRSFDDMAAHAFKRWNAPRPPRAASKRD